MFDNIKNMMSMMGQAKEMREKFAKLQEELGRKVVEGEAGAGAVRVKVNGRFEVVEMHLDRAMLLTLAMPGDGDGGGPVLAIVVLPARQKAASVTHAGLSFVQNWG